MSPASETELAGMLAEAAGPLRIVGGGTRAIGRASAGEVLSLSGLSGVKLYEPGALTLVVGAGTLLSEVEALLEKEGQMLPFEPPRMGGLLGREGESTIGGVVAANASGPRRMQAGACRDCLIGVRFVDGSGTILKNGGRVMKNVTGYDLVKLMAGSYGTLGVLSEVAFRVLPNLDGATLSVQVPSAAMALEVMTKAVTSPFDITGAAYSPDEAVYLRVEGLDSSVRYRVEQLKTLIGGEISVSEDPSASAAIWRRLRDVSDFAEGSAAVWRVSMKPSDMVEVFLNGSMGAAGFDYRLDWAGGLAWVRMTPEAVEEEIVAFHRQLQDMCGDGAKGHATLFKASESVSAKVTTFQPESPGVARLSRGLREKFDPRGILNPGLMGG
ncbi:FAD-binding protein [Rhodobacterales bacterium HKCCE4037]|nr:FAD-binding protein [Rhodobacterales bacterium HKCCE4037]